MTKTNGNGLIYVGIPRERVYIPKFVDNRDRLLAALQDAGLYAGHFQAESHRVDKNRDRITHEFMDHEKEPEWLVMIDSDMEHHPEAPMVLTSHGKPIVGGLYFHRGDTHDPFVFKEAGTRPDQYGRNVLTWLPMRDEVYEFLLGHNVPMRDGAILVTDLDDSLKDVDAVATGIIAIHRSVFEKMRPPWFEYRAGATSEDLMFCWMAKHKYEIPVHCDFAVISGHYAWQPMGQAQFRTLHEGRGINMTTYTRSQAIVWLSKYAGLSMAKAKLKIEKGNAHMVGDYWNKRMKGKEGDAKAVSRFYHWKRVGELYLIELLHWNFTMTFTNIRKQLQNVRDARILELGAGIGTVAMQLAIQNNVVAAVEPNDYLRGFIEYRWDAMKKDMVGKLGEMTPVKTWMDEAQDGSFDVVVSFDTFEHIPEAELRTTLFHIHRVLPIGGRLIYHANFKQQELYPMHFDYSDDWGQWLNELGFIHLSMMEAVKVR